MELKPKVSVIIPTYNRPDFLKRAVLSVLEQSYTLYEIIIVQNGPFRDMYQKLASEWEANPKITFYWLGQGDPSTARNYGAQQAKAEYLAFLDDDDAWYQDKLKIQIGELEQTSEVAFVAVAADIVDEADKIIGTAPNNAYSDDLVTLVTEGNTIYSLSLVMIRKNIFHQLGGLSSAFPVAADYDLYLKVASLYRFKTIHEPLAKYQRHSGNLSMQGEVNAIERARVLAALQACPDKGVTAKVIHKALRRIAIKLYSKGLSVYDQDKKQALSCISSAIRTDYLFGLDLPWMKSRNFMWRLFKPYYSLLRCLIGGQQERIFQNADE